VAQIDAVTANLNSFVPVIDIAPYLAGTPADKSRVTAELDRACREVGFYIIVGHGMEPRLIEQVETVSREFFDLPLDEKMKVHIGTTPGAVGYAAVGDVALAYTRGQVAPPDLNESFHVLSADLRRPWSYTRV
jgi:isopenicillin N synthase-like dioxygenase